MRCQLEIFSATYLRVATEFLCSGWKINCLLLLFQDDFHWNRFPLSLVDESFVNHCMRGDRMRADGTSPLARGIFSVGRGFVYISAPWVVIQFVDPPSRTRRMLSLCQKSFFFQGKLYVFYVWWQKGSRKCECNRLPKITNAILRGWRASLLVDVSEWNGLFVSWCLWCKPEVFCCLHNWLVMILINLKKSMHHIIIYLF